MGSKKSVRVLVDVNCVWRDEPPHYRAFVNEEMFTERTWIWRDAYLEEALVIVAPPGKYIIRYELVNADSGALHTTNWRVDSGPGRITDGVLEIVDENT